MNNNFIYNEIMVYSAGYLIGIMHTNLNFSVFSMTGAFFRKYTVN